MATIATGWSWNARAGRSLGAPETFFENLRFVRILPWLSLWQACSWRDLTAMPTSASFPANAGDILRPELGEIALARAAQAGARSLRYTPRTDAGRGLAPRFAYLPGEANPSIRTEEDRRATLAVAIHLRIRDVSDDFPAPVPRGLRVLALADQVQYHRDGLTPGVWTLPPDLVVETVTPATAEERVLQRLDAVVANALGRSVTGP